MRIPGRRQAAVALTVAVAIGALIVLYPARIDLGMLPVLLQTLTSLHEMGMPALIDYSFVESTANVLLFLPLGFLIATLAQRRWWIAPFLGVALSTSVELGQFLFLPGRVATVHDVVMNSIGALLGTVLMLVVRALTRTPAAVIEFPVRESAPASIANAA